MIAPERNEGAIIVSSEPLSEDPGWEKVPPNHLVLIPHHAAFEFRPLADVA
jgi:predicted glutamine amidotransferase